MKLRALENNDVPVIRCNGNMTTEEAARILKNAIDSCRDDSIVINLSKVGNIGHDVLTVISNAVDDGRSIILVELQSTVKSTVISKTDLLIYPEEETAIAEILSLRAV